MREVDLAGFGGGPLPLQNSRDVVSPCMHPSTLVPGQGERKCSSYQSTAVRRNLGVNRSGDSGRPTRTRRACWWG